MRPTILTSSPVVTFLSSSPSLSRRAQAALQSLFQLDAHDNLEMGHSSDKLNSLFRSLIPGLSKRWDSVVSQCHTSGTILHFLSVDGSVENPENEALALLAVTDDSMSDVINSLQAIRELLAHHMRDRATRIAVKQSMGQELTTFDLLGFGGGLPLLKPLDKKHASSTSRQSKVNETMHGLKELSLPHFDDAAYSDGKSLIESLSVSSLERPVVGLYQFPDGLAIRPLPSAASDKVIPSASLVFMCANIDDESSGLEQNGAVVGQIGFSGTFLRGQLMVRHPDVPGLDLRLTDKPGFSSSFAEAQEALMAGSLNEMQHENVLLKGGASREAQGKATDCWVEFRETLKQPSGYLQRNSQREAKVKVARVPDLPPE